MSGYGFLEQIVCNLVFRNDITCNTVKEEMSEALKTLNKQVF